MACWDPALCLRAFLALVCVVQVQPQGVVFPGSSPNSGSNDSCNLPSGDTGTCKPISDCPAVAQNVATQRPKICGFQGNIPVVCCPLAGCSLKCLNGECTSPNICKCKQGWTGDLCETAVCSPQCLNGECTGPSTCKCKQGWTGALCQTSVCSPKCLNGECAGPNICQCKQGWTGNLCQTPVCSPRCLNGECTSLSTCKCKQRWTGDLCQTPVCSPQCLNGKCTGPNICQCKQGWKGDQCQTQMIRLTDISPPDTDFECGKSIQVRQPIFFRSKRALAPGNPVFALPPGFPGINVIAIAAPTESLRNAWPWMVLLGQDRAVGRFWFCSGVLLNRRWVLTAAHCTNRFNATVARFGEHNINNPNDVVTVEDVGVAETVYHPGYQPPEAYHDIALIKLARQITIRRGISPVCLPWGQEADLPVEDKTVTITGWGATRFGDQLSPVLNEADVTVFKTDVCANSYSKLGDYTFNYPQGLGEESLCIGDNTDKGRDSCEGDSGGPAVLLRDGHFTLVGIVSKGFGCGKKDFPGIYVRVQYPEHLAWIKKVAFANI